MDVYKFYHLPLSKLIGTLGCNSKSGAATQFGVSITWSTPWQGMSESPRNAWSSVVGLSAGA